MTTVNSTLTVAELFDSGYQAVLNPSAHTGIEVWLNIDGSGSSVAVYWQNDQYPADPAALVSHLNSEFNSANSSALGIASNDPNHLAFVLLPDGRLQISSPSAFHLPVYPSVTVWPDYSSADDTDLRAELQFNTGWFMPNTEPEDPEPEEETGDLISHNPFNNLSVLSAPNKLTFCLTPTTNKTALLDLYSGTLIETTSTLQFISSSMGYTYFCYYIKGSEVNFNIQVPTSNTFLSQKQYFELENISVFSLSAYSSEDDLEVRLVNHLGMEQFLTTFPGDILAVSFNNNILSITNGNNATISTQLLYDYTFLNFFLTCSTYSLTQSYPLADINISFDSSVQIFPRTTTHTVDIGAQ